MIRPGFLTSSERRELVACVRSHREGHGVARRANAILRFSRKTVPKEWKAFRDQVSDSFRIVTHENFRVLA